MPAGAVLTTECNAEPYLDLFDAYLTWHFQYQDSVPLFAAVYGGRIQLFGRAYRGGPTADLALRMKAGQSLVFGEQLGWISPAVVKHEVNGPFLRRCARLRHRLRQYVSTGEMLTPPDFAGDVPTVTADWQWHGEWPITLRAVQAGAWRAPDGSVAVILVNVTDHAQHNEVILKSDLWGLRAASLSVSTVTETGKTDREPAAGSRRTVKLAPYDACAWILRTGGRQ
jgi:hypothetical protein